MEDRKERVKQLLLSVIEEVSGSQFNEDLLTDEIDSIVQDLDAQIVLGAIKLLPGGLSGNSKIVVCAMPNNNQTIARAAALQCQNAACSRHFCKVHKISQCPLCGGSLQ